MKINSGQAPSTLIPEYIGTDFDKVIEVADNIEYVKDVAAGIEGLPVHGYIGETPPTQPRAGAEWYCTLDGRTYVWYVDDDSGQWVESSPQSNVTDLSDNVGAAKIGTSDGYTVQEKLDQVNTAVWNRKVVEAAINNTFVNYVDGDRTLTPRLSFEGYHYLPLFDATTPVSFTGLPTKNGDGTITVATDKGDCQFSRVIAEATNQESEIIASGSTTGRKIADRFADVINVRDFGAKGDGVTDDTVAIRTALSKSNVTVYIPSGVYRVTSTINITGSNINVICHGQIVIAATIPTLCVVSGSDVVIDGLRINGNRTVGFAVKVTGDKSIIKNCVVENLYGTTTNGCAFHFEGDIEFIAKGNIVRNVDAVPNGVIGDAIGASRAFLVSHNNERKNHGVIEDNIIDVVVGEEGDAIQVLCNAGTVPYANGNVTIKRNYIKDCNRRAIKIQASGCIVTDNEHVNTLLVDQISQPGPLINVIVGSNNVISNNKVNAGATLNGIYVTGQDAAIITGNVITNNTIECGLGTSGNEGIYLENNNGFTCDDNNIINGNSFAIAVGKCSGGSISRNKISGSSSSSGKPAINITPNCDKLIISGNVNLNGTRAEFIRCSAQKSIIRDNHNFSSDTSTNIRANASAVATLIDDNTNTNGLAVYGSADDLKAAYLGSGNRGLGVGSSAPSHNFVVDHPHEHKDLYWARGDIAWNTNQSGSTTLAWKCTGSGVGAASTWRTIPDNAL